MMTAKHDQAARPMTEEEYQRCRACADAYINVGWNRNIYAGRDLEAYVKKLEKLELAARCVKQAFKIMQKREDALYKRLNQFGFETPDECFAALEKIYGK
jgi:RecB family exonuclease